MPVSPTATHDDENRVRTWSSSASRPVAVGHEDPAAAVAVAGHAPGVIGRRPRPGPPRRPGASSSTLVGLGDVARAGSRRRWAGGAVRGGSSADLARRPRRPGRRPPPPRPRRAGRPRRSAVWAKPVVSPDDDPDAGAAVAARGQLLDLAVVEHGGRRRACPRRTPRRSRRRCAGRQPRTRWMTASSITETSFPGRAASSHRAGGDPDPFRPPEAWMRTVPACPSNPA